MNETLNRFTREYDVKCPITQAKEKEKLSIEEWFACIVSPSGQAKTFHL